MGGVLQDSLNEMGVKQATSSGNNPLQAILGNLGGLQQAIKMNGTSRSRISSNLAARFAGE
ncbi:hypothetical protein BCY80_06470 [Yersinia pestis]|nr:hypothetical protein AU254_03225 [Yersinia pestis]PVF68485.1 hypothetical protein BCY80_06470 [Yersinia pestis]